MIRGGKFVIFFSLAVANKETKMSLYLPLDKNAITEPKLLMVFPVSNVPFPPFMFFVISANLN
jgi:hypothetical protein